MSRDFNGSSQYGLATGAASSLTAYPFTLAAWAKTSASGRVMHLTKSTGYPTAFPSISSAASGGNIFGESSSPYASTSNSAANTGWLHLCGTWTSTATRIVLNGDWANSGTTSSPPTFESIWDDVGVAALINNDGGSGYLASLVAHVALWNVALSQSEVESLAAGANPLAVQNSALIGYWPMAGTTSPEPDDAANNDMTLTGSPGAGASDPTVDPPPSGVSIPVIMHHLQQQGIR